MTTTTIDAARAVFLPSVSNGGGTFTRDGQPVTKGIAVGVRTIATGPSLAGIIDEAVEQIEGGFIGTWHDHENDVWEVQESAVFTRREDAVLVAKALGERYVYDITNDECIATS